MIEGLIPVPWEEQQGVFTGRVKKVMESTQFVFVCVCVFFFLLLLLRLASGSQKQAGEGGNATQDARRYATSITRSGGGGIR